MCMLYIRDILVQKNVAGCEQKTAGFLYSVSSKRYISGMSMTRISLQRCTCCYREAGSDTLSEADTLWRLFMHNRVDEHSRDGISLYSSTAVYTTTHALCVFDQLVVTPIYLGRHSAPFGYVFIRSTSV